MTTRENIRRVLEFDHPERVGMTWSDYEGQPRLDDLAYGGAAADPERAGTDWTDDGEGGELRTDEWGNLWRRIQNRTSQGEVRRPALATWEDLDSYVLPTLDNPARYEGAARAREENPDKYFLGGIAGAAFNVTRYLRRMEQYLLDCAESPEQVKRLNRMVNDLILRQIDIYADLGADGVTFAEDWGTEDRLLVSPRMWDEIFRPDFARLIDRAHQKGLTVWMHCCGYIKDLIPRLAEMGMDVMQLDQPELSGLEFLAEYPMTYWCPVDIQKILPTGNRELIEARAREMLRLLAGRGGGFIGKDYGDNKSIGVDPLWQHWVYELFLQEGRY